MLEMTRDLSSKVSNACFLAACLVVGIHVAVRGSFVPFICSVAVPLFFIISGFLMVGHCDEKGWWIDSLKKRIRTLLIPYLLINGLWFPVVFVLHTLAVKYAGADPVSMPPLSWRTPFEVFGLRYPDGTYAVGMWYVRALMMLAVASPLFVWPIRRSRLAALGVVGVLVGFAVWGDMSGANKVLFLPPYSLACFAIGIALRCWAKTLLWSKWWALPSVIVGLLLVSGGGGICCTLIISFAFWSVVPCTKWPRWLVGNSFPLFVLHPMVLYLGTYLMKGVHCYSWLSCPLGYMIGWAVLIPLTCAVAAFIKSKFPRCAKLVFGGR